MSITIEESITVKELRVKRVKFEDKIRDDIKKFNEETGVYIESINANLDYSVTFYGRYGYSVNIELDIK